ncbi:MAG: TIGR03790 family protein [bacterium]|jgi:uncharacterized protein (TIGR03790 family)
MNFGFTFSRTAVRFVLVFSIAFAAASCTGGAVRTNSPSGGEFGVKAPAYPALADRAWDTIELGGGLSLRYASGPAVTAYAETESGNTVVTVSSERAQQLAELISELHFDKSGWHGVSAEFAGALADAQVTLVEASLPGRIAAGAAFAGLAPVQIERGEVLARFVVAPGPARSPSQAGPHPPSGVANKPGLLSVSFADLPPRLLVQWNQRNTGDYDQNGEVGVADITPIALFYGATSGTVLAVADGDQNGEVGVSDITPIAINYLSTLTGYNVYLGYKAESAQPFEYTLAASVGLAAPPAADQVVRHSLYLDLGAYGDYEVRVVPLGPESVEAGQETWGNRPYSFRPPVPAAPANQRATFVDRENVTIEWDALTDPVAAEILCWKSTTGGSDLADYTLDATLAPTETSHTFAGLTPLTDYYFVITTRSAEQIPSAVPSPVQAYTAVAPVAVLTGPDQTMRNLVPSAPRFDASGSTDSDGTVVEYHWDWGDATAPDVTTVPQADHTWTNAGLFTVTLTVVDNDGAVSAPVTHDVTVVAGREDVLVVYSTVFPGSQELAEYYADITTGRGIDPGNLYGVAWDDPDESNLEIVRRGYYDSTIRPEIEAHLTDTGLKDEIKFIVLCKGVPLKIKRASGSSYNDYDEASVDAELCCIFDADYNIAGRNINPFRAELVPTAAFLPFAYTYEDLTLAYLVSRLDAYTIDEAKLIVDRSKAAPGNTDGWIVLDDQSDKNYDMMHSPTADGRPSATTVLNNFGANLFEDDTPAFVNRTFIDDDTISQNLIGLCSHGVHAANDPGVEWILTGVDFAYRPGAMFITYESFNGWSFTEGGRNGQSLIADFIRMGGTCGIGNVWEPLSDAVGDESVAFVRYLQGDTSVEALYRSMRYVSWVEVVVGDPLCTITD